MEKQDQQAHEARRSRKRMKRKKSNQKKKRDSPHALQILLPTSSLLQSGVVLVPQLAQLRAPTAARTFLPAPAPPAPWLLLTSPSFAVPGEAAAAPASLGDPPASGLPVFSTPTMSASLCCCCCCFCCCSSRRAETDRALLYVGHPEHDDDPPVPSQRPSPGHVPPVLVVCVFAVVVGEALLAEDAAGA